MSGTGKLLRALSPQQREKLEVSFGHLGELLLCSISGTDTFEQAKKLVDCAKSFASDPKSAETVCTIVTMLKNFLAQQQLFVPEQIYCDAEEPKDEDEVEEADEEESSSVPSAPPTPAPAPVPATPKACANPKCPCFVDVDSFGVPYPTTKDENVVYYETSESAPVVYDKLKKVFRQLGFEEDRYPAILYNGKCKFAKLACLSHKDAASIQSRLPNNVRMRHGQFGPEVKYHVKPEQGGRGGGGGGGEIDYEVLRGHLSNGEHLLCHVNVPRKSPYFAHLTFLSQAHADIGIQILEEKGYVVNRWIEK